MQNSLIRRIVARKSNFVAQLQNRISREGVAFGQTVSNKDCFNNLILAGRRRNAGLRRMRWRMKEIHCNDVLGGACVCIPGIEPAHLLCNQDAGLYLSFHHYKYKAARRCKVLYCCKFLHRCTSVKRERSP